MSFGITREIKSASVYIVANLFSRGLAIITVPIFTRLMAADQIGVVTIYSSWFSMISTFSTLSLTSGGFSLAMKEYSMERDKYVSSVLSLTTLIAALIAAVFFLNINLWEDIIGLPRSLILLMLAGLIVSPARDFWLAKERYEYKYKAAAVVTIISAVLASFFSILVVIWANNNQIVNTGYYRLLTNYTIIYAIDVFLFILLFLKGRSFIRTDYWGFSLKLSLPLVGYSISTQILNVSDRMMIDKMVGRQAVGIYGTLYTVSAISLMMWTTINSSFVPYLFERIETHDKSIGRITNILLFTYSGITVFLTYFSPEIVRVLATEEYYYAIYIMPPIASGVFMISVSNIYSNILVYYKKTTYIMYGSIIAAVINVVLNFIFINMFGFIAAAYTTLFSYALLAILEYYWSELYRKKESHIESSFFDNKTIFFLSIGTMALCMSGLIVYNMKKMRYFLGGAIGALWLIILVKNRKQSQQSGI